jgi:Asp-tRNA(Asn)/Glu-tRNA(Gln) amidotransferase A subunit family amidase
MSDGTDQEIPEEPQVPPEASEANPWGGAAEELWAAVEALSGAMQHIDLPIGVQLIARPAGEASLIRLCSQLEEAPPPAPSLLKV